PFRLAAGAHVRPSAASILASVVVVAGIAILLLCVWDFFAVGRGTLAPVDPPRRLVVRGLYRYTRNPMYNGVLLALIGEAWLFRSAPILIYVAAVFAAVHLFVVLYEEPVLTRRFGDEYRAYRAAVPRWGATRHGYHV
ncbi:MAG TPA: isoprenylcysteine carboxylmethyltransferase family protein, partial [Thermoanaerobaculia bacterium]|nr:isoprenylcysteine carboxylmethyltransferase family protein [Thermoanaerobaculia bacterium]